MLFGDLCVGGGGGVDSPLGHPNGDSTYAYVDTVIAYNVHRACGIVIDSDDAVYSNSNGTLPTATRGAGDPSSLSPLGNQGGGG